MDDSIVVTTMLNKETDATKKTKKLSVFWSILLPYSCYLFFVFAFLFLCYQYLLLSFQILKLGNIC